MPPLAFPSSTESALSEVRPLIPISPIAYLPSRRGIGAAALPSSVGLTLSLLEGNIRATGPRLKRTGRRTDMEDIQ